MAPSENEIESREPLGEAIASYLRAQDAGSPIDREKFLAAHPELRGELESFVSNYDRIETMSHPIRDLGPQEPDRPRGARIGRYELQEVIGRGGMGVVYRARDLGLQRTVALKMIRAGNLATAEDLQRFRDEAKAAGSLDHPHIVPVYEWGEEDGQQYFTMGFIEGQTLERHKADFLFKPREAAHLIAQLARAVHHAHQRRIIHRDLKPGNILVDPDGQPHITDFGLALRVAGGDRLTESNVLIGTLPYMSPEQLSEKVQPLTTSVDLWSLGVILYELVTGKNPFQGRTQIHTLDRIRKEAPLPPRSINPHLDRDLEAVCLRCLEKDPERRYSSTMGLAKDLERWLRGEQTDARPLHPGVRAWRWCLRNPARAALVAGSVFLALALGLGTMVRMVHVRAAQDEKVRGLVHMARFASNVILMRMQEWGTRVQGLAGRRELVGLLADWRRSLKERPSKDPEVLRQRPEARALQAFLESLPREPMVVNWQIMDADGVMMARKPSSVLGVNFKERDYLQGTLRHAGRSGAESVHVSSVYRSQVDGLDKFDICAPVAEAETILGILAVSITTDPTLGVPHMHDDVRKVVLVAPWDPSPPRERHPEGGTPRFVVLLHPAMVPGQEALPFEPRNFPSPFPRNCENELTMTDNRPIGELSRRDYVDPFGLRDPGYRGPWFAAFAPVGNTGFVVIVQQRAD